MKKRALRQEAEADPAEVEMLLQELFACEKALFEADMELQHAKRRAAMWKKIVEAGRTFREAVEAAQRGVEVSL